MIIISYPEHIKYLLFVMILLHCNLKHHVLGFSLACFPALLFLNMHMLAQFDMMHCLQGVLNLLNWGWLCLLICLAGRGMHILYKDVQSCQDEDVHVLWSILIDSHRHPAVLKLKL